MALYYLLSMDDCWLNKVPPSDGHFSLLVVSTDQVLISFRII